MVRKFKGIAAAPGIAIGPVVHFHSTLDQIPTWKVAPDQVEGEKQRLDLAIGTVTENLLELQRELASALGSHDARIFDAQLAIVHDPTFRRDVEAEIENGNNLETAFQRVIARYEEVFHTMEHSAMRERAADLRDIGRQLVAAVMATERKQYTAQGRDYLFAADEFLPSDAGLLDRQHIRGIITAHGGKYSHGAILSRSLGIPAVVGIEGLMLETATGATAIVDGDAGLVIIDPAPEELEHYERLRNEQQAIEKRLAEIRLMPAVTSDGVAIDLMANAESVRDLDGIETDEVAGVGLFRTEFAFMERRQFPTEEEQVVMYSQAMERAGGKPVTFRTLDVGGDKPLGYFRMPEERNPVLGWRGIRLCLDWPDILYTQMRAILRASTIGHARILLPMITSRSEVVRCREVLERLTEDLRASGVSHDGDIELGIMIEVPVLVHILPDVLPLVDFVSVGTNDLVQYLLAVDRDNQRVAKMYDPCHPGVLRVLQQIADAVNAAGKRLSICGEIAGDHWMTPILVGMGIHELSMAPVFLRRVKMTLRSFSTEECRDLARRVASEQSTRAVRKIIEEEVQARWSSFLEAGAEESGG